MPSLDGGTRRRPAALKPPKSSRHSVTVFTPLTHTLHSVFPPASLQSHSFAQSTAPCRSFSLHHRPHSSLDIHSSYTAPSRRCRGPVRLSLRCQPLPSSANLPPSATTTKQHPNATKTSNSETKTYLCAAKSPNLPPPPAAAPAQAPSQSAVGSWSFFFSRLQNDSLANSRINYRTVQVNVE
jgi:hypothetical protein